MSVKNALLKALGFSSADDDDYDEMADLPSALPVNRQSPRETVDATDVSATDAGVEETSVENFEFPLSVFDGLLKVFNDAQPDFIQKCVDTDAQRRYLYDSIDASFKEAFADYGRKAREAADRQNASVLRRADSETSELRKQLEATRKSLAEAKEQNLSAVRQRRAFNERIRDLEQQLETEKAEKDQYALETKSLLNKIKVAQVQGASDVESAEEIERLRQSIEKLQLQLADAEAEKQNLSRQLVQKQSDLDVALADLATAREEVIARPTVVSFAEATAPEPAVSSDYETEPVQPRQQNKKKKQRRTKVAPTPSISVIDDTLDTTEWLVPTPPAGSAKPISSVSDSEFGYHEPQREDPPANDAQLSLFD